MDRQGDFNLEHLVELVIIDAALMPGNDFFAGVQAGTVSFDDAFARCCYYPFTRMRSDTLASVSPGCASQDNERPRAMI